jgi:hypothetical protein
VVRSTGLTLQLPADVGSLAIVERLDGDATTDFGAPSAAPDHDALPLAGPELERLLLLLDACWQAFERAARDASGKELRKGPRGGGRELEGVVAHVLESAAGYLRQIGGSAGPGRAAPEERLGQLRRAAGEALAAAARGELPSHGPRGGKRWSPRYFARRTAWHLLDHVWELEDRSS